MKWKDILDFVKIEHTLFSLPFVLMGFILAKKQLGEEIFEVSLSNLIYSGSFLQQLARAA